MVKTIGILMVIAASTAAGFILADSFKKRLSQLKEFQSALIQLQNEIFYTKTTLPEACMNISLKARYPVNMIFKTVYENLNENFSDSVYDAFVRALEQEKSNCLLESDKSIILNLAKSLGESDIEGHKKVFNLADHDLKNTIGTLEIQLNKNIKMYRYLGFSFGAVIAILLI